VLDVKKKTQLKIIIKSCKTTCIPCKREINTLSMERKKQRDIEEMEKYPDKTKKCIRCKKLL